MVVGFFATMVESDGQRALIMPVVVQRASDQHHLVGGRASLGSQWLAQNAQPFDRGQHMLHRHARSRQLPVGLFVPPVQRASAGFLVRRAHLGRSRFVTLKSTVAQQSLVFAQTHPRPVGLGLVVPHPGAVGVNNTTRPPAVTTTFLTVVRLRRPL